MAAPIPSPFDIIPLLQASMPTNYRSVFLPVPYVMLTTGLIFGIYRHHSERANLKGLLMSAIFFISIATLFAFVSDQYTLTYIRDRGCKDATQGTYVTVVPLFMSERYQSYGPLGPKFDSLSCRDYDSIMWSHAKAGLLTTLALMVAALSGACFSLGAIFSWAYVPVTVLRKTIKNSYRN